MISTCPPRLPRAGSRAHLTRTHVYQRPRPDYSTSWT
jgi:hypothetical protein